MTVAGGQPFDGEPRVLTQDELETITNRLRALARDGGAIEAAQVRLIGIDEIREAAGANWPRLRERVRDGSMRILSRHADAQDVILPAGDGFLIILAEGPPAECQRRCQIMRDALLAFYLGEEGLTTLRPEVKPRVLSSDGLTDLLAAGVSKPARPGTPGPRALGQEIAHVRVFMTHEQRIGARLLTPVAHQRGGPRMTYNPEFILDGRHHAPQNFLDLDVAVLDEALAAIATARSEGRTCVYGLTIHSSTLQHRRTREDYLGWWRRTPADLKRSLFVSIAEIEKGTPLLSLAEWTAALRPYVSRMALNFHWSDHAIANIGAAGAWSAGFHLPIYAGAQKGARAERLLDQVRFWAKALHGQAMRLTVNGFQDLDFLEQAMALGVDYSTSDALWPFSEGAFGPPPSTYASESYGAA